MAISALLLIMAVPMESQRVHTVTCDHTTASCECNRNADVCNFTLQVSLLHTFTRYSVTTEGRVDDLDGYIYTINNAGRVVPFDPESTCDLPDCTEAATVDGRTFRPYIAINGQIPGPTLISLIIRRLLSMSLILSEHRGLPSIGMGCFYVTHLGWMELDSFLSAP